MSIYALLPAAGLSSRMGRPKLALPLGDRSVLERVIATVNASTAIQGTLAVLGPQVAGLKTRAENAGAWAFVLDHQTPDMLATIQAGLDWLARHKGPCADDAFLLLPPDHPTLREDVIDLLVSARSDNPASTIWLPTHEAKRGHPTLIRWSHVPAICALPIGHGLNAYLRGHADETMEVACTTSDILCDLDTPADYERLQRMYALSR
jgi:molybdenum cofactor cytidylyltransferase